MEGTQADQWALILEDRDAVVAALERGECDGILPAACGWLDEFGCFCVESGMPELLALLPDARARCSMPAALFGTVLLYKQLLRIPSFAQMGRVLFRSPALLRQRGFNRRQVNEGFYAGAGRTPFDEEARADFFAGIDRDELWAFQQRLLPALVEQCPELLGKGILVMDCLTVSVPAGHRKRAGGKYKACVLMSYRDGCIYPLLCRFGDEHTADLTLGPAMMDALLELLPEQHWTLLLDRGFIDGEWIGELTTQGVDVVIGVRSDMDLFEDALGPARLPGDIEAQHDGVLVGKVAGRRAVQATRGARQLIPRPNGPPVDRQVLLRHQPAQGIVVSGRRGRKSVLLFTKWMASTSPCNGA